MTSSVAPGQTVEAIPLPALLPPGGSAQPFRIGIHLWTARHSRYRHAMQVVDVIIYVLVGVFGVVLIARLLWVLVKGPRGARKSGLRRVLGPIAGAGAVQSRAYGWKPGRSPNEEELREGRAAHEPLKPLEENDR